MTNWQNDNYVSFLIFWMILNFQTPLSQVTERRNNPLPAVPSSISQSSARVAWDPWHPDSDLSQSSSSLFVVDDAWNWYAYASYADSDASYPVSLSTHHTQSATPSTRTTPWDAVVLQWRCPLESLFLRESIKLRFDIVYIGNFVSGLETDIVNGKKKKKKKNPVKNSVIVFYYRDRFIVFFLNGSEDGKVREIQGFSFSSLCYWNLWIQEKYSRSFKNSQNLLELLHRF